jgi:hypothetical protein
MVNSFDSWNKINEGAFGQNRSKQVYVSPNGKKYKVVIKIQNDKNFMVKTINEMQILDSNSNMTNAGAAALKNYLNSQNAFLNTFGQLDSNFFGKYFIIYTVKKDTARKEKIQFTVAPRTELPELEANVEFVPTSSLAAITNKTEVFDGIIRVNIETVESDDGGSEETEEAEDGTTDDAGGSEVTEESLGNRFRYTMSTNGVTYECTIGVEGSIDMEPYRNATGPVGSISWESPKVVWYTDADNNLGGGQINNSPLWTDAEITNRQDKDFFTKMFTDKAFKDKIIKKYEDEYGDSEMNGDNLRNMLYYDDGTQIFPSTASSETGDGAPVTGTSHVASWEKGNYKNF